MRDAAEHVTALADEFVRDGCDAYAAVECALWMRVNDPDSYERGVPLLARDIQRTSDEALYGLIDTRPELLRAAGLLPPYPFSRSVSHMYAATMLFVRHHNETLVRDPHSPNGQSGFILHQGQRLAPGEAPSSGDEVLRRPPPPLALPEASRARIAASLSAWTAPDVDDRTARAGLTAMRRRHRLPENEDRRKGKLGLRHFVLDAREVSDALAAAVQSRLPRGRGHWDGIMRVHPRTGQWQLDSRRIREFASRGLRREPLIEASRVHPTGTEDSPNYLEDVCQSRAPDPAEEVAEKDERQVRLKQVEAYLACHGAAAVAAAYYLANRAHVSRASAAGRYGVTVDRLRTQEDHLLGLSA